MRLERMHDTAVACGEDDLPTFWKRCGQEHTHRLGIARNDFDRATLERTGKIALPPLFWDKTMDPDFGRMRGCLLGSLVLCLRRFRRLGWRKLNYQHGRLWLLGG